MYQSSLKTFPPAPTTKNCGVLYKDEATVGLSPIFGTKLWPAASSAFIKEQGVLQVRDEQHDSHTTSLTYVGGRHVFMNQQGSRVARINNTNGLLVDDKNQWFPVFASPLSSCRTTAPEQHLATHLEQGS